MNKNVKLDSSNDLMSATVHGLSHDGRGIATINQLTTFISGALKDEEVTYRITQKHRNYQEAVLQSIIRPSRERVDPPCQHFGLCGGCSLQHMSVTTQIALKQQTLLDQLHHFGRVTPYEVLSPLSADDIGYRRKARLGVKFVIKKDKVLVGFREKSSNYLADLSECKVLHPKVGLHLKALQELVASLTIYQQIPQIEVAIGDEEAALVIRHMQALTEDDKTKLITFAKENNFHLYLQPNAPQKVHKLWPNDAVERLTYTLPDHELTFHFHPLDFTQVNLALNRKMVNLALELLSPNMNDHVLDLFCGIGNFTLPIAKKAAHVVGIEGNDEMVGRAYENARANNISNVAFHAANLANDQLNAPWLMQTYDKILLDPPRVGAKEILPFIKKMSAKRLVYVSCNPATLARDAGELVHDQGYQLTKVGVMNMFPHTSHIEAIAVFEQ